MCAMMAPNTVTQFTNVDAVNNRSRWYPYGGSVTMQG
jgi:hypothetical protein